MKPNLKKWLGLILLILVAGVGLLVSLPFIKAFFASETAAANPVQKSSPPAQLIRDRNDNNGLRLTQEVIKGLGIKPEMVLKATNPRALPPQVGTLNYDNERLFIIKSRFPGEVAEIKKIRDDSSPLTPSRFRFLRYGDKIKQGELLAVVWSRDLGEKKAALVDAMSAYELSKAMLDRMFDLYKIGAISEAVYRTQERQVQQDGNNILTAERTLRMWKLTDPEIKTIKDEAKKIIKMVANKTGKRDPEKEKIWARVEMKTPIFSDDPDKLLTIVEKNSHLNDMVDPTVIMFKLADMSKLQIWVNIREELLSSMKKRQKDPQGKLKWKIQIEGDSKPLELEISQIAPSLDPNLHTLTVIGYLDNPDGKYHVGQFVTASIYVDPQPDTVEISTDALNEVEGEALVFVQHDAEKPEFFLRRVAVANRFKDVTLVRSKLSEQDQKRSQEEIKKNKRPIQPLLPGERVVTRGVVELTAALDDLVNKDRIERAGKK